MTGDYTFRSIPGILYFMFTLLLLSGCIAENTDDCFKGIPLKVNPVFGHFTGNNKRYEPLCL